MSEQMFNIHTNTCAIIKSVGKPGCAARAALHDCIGPQLRHQPDGQSASPPPITPSSSPPYRNGEGDRLDRCPSTVTDRTGVGFIFLPLPLNSGDAQRVGGLGVDCPLSPLSLHREATEGSGEGFVSHHLPAPLVRLSLSLARWL